MATYPEFKSPLINVWQYLNRNLPYFRKALGIVQEPVATIGFDPDCASSCNKVNNYTLTIDGQQFDVYRLQGVVTMQDGVSVYGRLLGSLTTSSPVLTIVKNSTDVEAFDIIFQTTNTAICTGSLVQDADPFSITFGEVLPVDLMFVNTDNAITTADEHFFYIIGGASFPFNCLVNVDLEVAVVKGSTVEYSTL